MNATHQLFSHSTSYIPHSLQEAGAASLSITLSLFCGCFTASSSTTTQRSLTLQEREPVKIFKELVGGHDHSSGSRLALLCARRRHLFASMEAWMLPEAVGLVSLSHLQDDDLRGHVCRPRMQDIARRCADTARNSHLFTRVDSRACTCNYQPLRIVFAADKTLC